MKAHDKIFEGLSIREMLERDEKKSIIVPENHIENLENYIILPGRKHGNYEYPDLLVSKEVYHKGKDWNQCHNELIKENSFMLTPRQFVDFLNILKCEDKVYNGKGHILDSAQTLQIYNKITEVRDPYRAEWLDARFSKQGDDLYINYHILRNNVLNEIKEKLEDCIMEDKTTPGIDLKNWITNANYQGLPKQNIKPGNMFYWCPVNGAVVRFWAYSNRAILNCYRDHTFTIAGLGVRRARIFNK